MRTLMLRLLIVAVTVGVGQYALKAETVQGSQGPISTMTVPQMEAAGDAARATKNFEEAIQYYQAATRKDSRNPKLCNKLGIAQLRQGQLKAARFSFQRAIKLDSKYADALNNLGAVYYMQKNYGGALKQFKKAVALDETRAVFHVNLGAAWFAQKKLDHAIAEYARALELNPDALLASSGGVTAQIASPEERARYAYMLAKIYAQRGDADECLRHLRKAKEEGYRDLANIYKDPEFAKMRTDPRFAEIASPPAN
jgi:tetratricopeptide (TPR) repeat protein